MKRSYVTAFPGRRDNYQVPLALSESGRLAGFVTCFYRDRGIFGRMPILRGRIRERHIDGIQAADVKCMELTNLAARVAQRFIQPSRVGVWEDNRFARRAVALANGKKAGLFLYEFQADWAFRQPFNHDIVKILFQFHPHPDLEHPLLLSDGEKYPQFRNGIRRNTRTNLPEFYRRHTRDAWRNADHVIAASQFTSRSLQVAGCPEGKITVIPYGTGMTQEKGERVDIRPPANRPYFLFVGSASHRKGLHHLLEAWSRSRLSSSHELVVIARVVEPELQELLSLGKSVRHIAGVSRADLVRWYGSATAFVLPSLSEGFGHVYMEALSCGCPVIGTRNSMLPDFADAQAHIRYVEPGDSESIRSELERVADLPAEDHYFRTGAVRESVKAWTWPRFRQSIEAVLQRFDT